ncbi:MAG TPA: flavin reductase family protein [Candidatus Mcinerneyibacterium sp.]|nr:flavin reductase family protein [Candidatus Mcinerneyibacterium sp.]
MKKEFGPIKHSLQPRPNVIVSCRSKEGKNNALAVAYASNCSYEPPMIMVGIVPSRYSYHMINENGFFVVNLVPKSMKKEYYYLGSKSGRDENKLEKLNLKIKDGKKVNAPVLLDFPVNIECKVVDSMKTGSHEMFAGKVLYTHVDKKLIDSEGKPDFGKIDYL